MAEKIWIRDAVVWKTDVGSSDGILTFDLLHKARTGKGAGTGPDALSFAQTLPGSPVRGPRASNLDIRSGMRSTVETGLLGGLAISGARILRTRLHYGLIVPGFGATPPVDPDWETPADRGWFNGLVVMPWSHPADVMSEGEGAPALPANSQYSVTVDWMWWSRVYMNSNGYKKVSVEGVSVLDSALVYDEIDTRNGRRIESPGNSLYWVIQPSFPTASAPTTGTTINGGVANWSVLLQLP